MSAHKYFMLRCDWPECKSHIATIAIDVRRARFIAASKGWLYKQREDICPIHEEKQIPVMRDE